MSAGDKRAHIAAIVLAAGLSTRMAPRNKLLMPHTPSAAPMVAQVAAAALASDASSVLVVTGHEAERVRAALATHAVEFVHVPDYASGMAASLRAGIAALPANVDAALICLGDMPLVTTAVMNRLIAAYDPEAGRAIVVPAFEGRRGNPVLWDRRFFADILALTGDTGARGLMTEFARLVVEVEVGDEGVLVDFDDALGIEEEGRLLS